MLYFELRLVTKMFRRYGRNRVNGISSASGLDHSHIYCTQIMINKLE